MEMLMEMEIEQQMRQMQTPHAGSPRGNQNDLRPQLKTILCSILRQRSQSEIDSSE